MVLIKKEQRSIKRKMSISMSEATVAFLFGVVTGIIVFGGMLLIK